MRSFVSMRKTVVIGIPLLAPGVKNYHPQEAFPASCQLEVITPLLTAPCTASVSALKAEPMSDFSQHVQGLALGRFPADQDSRALVFCHVHTWLNI